MTDDPFTSTEDFQEPERDLAFYENMLSILYFDHLDKDCDYSEVEADIKANIARLKGIDLKAE